MNIKQYKQVIEKLKSQPKENKKKIEELTKAMNKKFGQKQEGVQENAGTIETPKKTSRKRPQVKKDERNSK